MTTEICDIFQNTQRGESGQLSSWQQSENPVRTRVLLRPHDISYARTSFTEVFQQVNLQTIPCLRA